MRERWGEDARETGGGCERDGERMRKRWGDDAIITKDLYFFSFF